MSENKNAVAALHLEYHKPTAVSFQQLYTWVIWQFPRPHRLGMCGAVRPPLPDHGWYPAIIDGKRKKVRVYAHLDEVFADPETAVSYFDQPQSAPASEADAL